MSDDRTSLDLVRAAKSYGSNLNAADLDMIVRGCLAYTRPLKAQIAALTARIAALEAGGAKSLIDAYRGAFKQGETDEHGQLVQFRRGDLVTHRGALWFVNADCDSSIRPGESRSHTLCVKAGKNARDVRAAG